MLWWGIKQNHPGAERQRPTQIVNHLIHIIGNQHRMSDRSEGDQQQTAQHKTRHAALALIDLDGVGALTLGKYWQERNTAEREAFIQLLAQLLTRIAFPQSASFFQQLPMTVTDERINGQNAVVATTMHHPKEGDITIDYHLIQRDASWLIRDVHLDGVSLTRNLRAQAHQIIAQHSYEELLNRMRQKLATATAKATP